MEIVFKHDGFTLYAYNGLKELGHLILDTSNDEHPCPASIYVEPEFRRNGVATALYQEAARRLAGMGLKLYASNFQHERAQAVWKKMQTTMPDNVGCENGRMFLSFL